MIKLLTIVGARPQFIKAAAISRAIKTKFQTLIDEVIVHTGQHYDKNLSKVFFEELEIPKEKYNLSIGSGSHASQTASMMNEIERVILLEQPDAVLLYGDTNSTLAASLVAIKLHLKIIHVEAGVRSYNKKFPEEVNRLICDHLSTLLFVPSEDGMRSLKQEGFKIDDNSNGELNASNPLVFRCGDIMYDNTLHFLNVVEKRGKSFFEDNDLPSSNYILATFHRPSNVDQYESLKRIISAFNKISEVHDKTIIIPLHPRTRKKLESSEELMLLLSDRIRIIPPVSFLEMVSLEQYSDLVITDSGGVQKEAYFMEKPCLIMLEETPWVELVESGNARLVGSDYEKIVEATQYYLNDKKDFSFKNLFGNGNASEFICQTIVDNII